MSHGLMVVPLRSADKAHCSFYNRDLLHKFRTLTIAVMIFGYPVNTDSSLVELTNCTADIITSIQEDREPADDPCFKKEISCPLNSGRQQCQDNNGTDLCNAGVSAGQGVSFFWLHYWCRFLLHHKQAITQIIRIQILLAAMDSFCLCLAIAILFCIVLYYLWCIFLPKNPPLQ